MSRLREQIRLKNLTRTILLFAMFAVKTPAVSPMPRVALRRGKCRCRTMAVLGGVCAIALGSRAAEAPAGLAGKPLADRSGPRGATLFTPMPSAVTGIVAENRYADPRMWGERYHEFGVGAIGTGVAIGDYDGDGRPDVFVVSKTESGRLFRNLGDWKFEDVTDKTGLTETSGEWKQGATFADVNNDARLDLYVCRFNAPNLLYVQQADGTFKEMARACGLDVADASSMAAFCDYDRDGWLDVYLQTNLLAAAAHPNGQRDYLFHNNRDGKFTNVTERAGIKGETQGHSVTWWDYDRDGWPDLYVANDFAAPDSLYRNQRDGTFANTARAVLPHTPLSSMGADLGDVNNDGLMDFLVADMAASTHEKDQRGMADSRARAKEEPADATAAPQYQRNALFINTGQGPMQEAAFLAGVAATDWTWSVRFEDLDNDGRVDLHVTNGMNREQHNSDLLARMMGAETPAERVRLMRASPVLIERNFAFRNQGELHFENSAAAWGLDQKGVSFGAAFGDLDGDGDLDLVFTNYQAGVTVLRNDSDTGHRLMVELRGASNRFGVGATVRLETNSGVQVRQLVLARGYLSSSEPVLHFGLGEETRIHRLTVVWPSGLTQSFADLAADRRLTITEPAEGARSIPVPTEEKSPAPQFTDVSGPLNLSWSARGEFAEETALQPFLPMRHNRRGPGLAVGNLDGDQLDDLVLGGTTLDPARVLRGNESGPFLAAAFPSPSPVDDGPPLIFDVDGDGKNDLLFTRGGASLPNGASEYQPKLFFNTGNGSLRPGPDAAIPPLPVSVGAAAAADFDRDGRLDLFIGGRVRPGEYPQAPRSALLVNRGGKFEDITETQAPGLREIGMVTSGLWSDVDDDGWPDLLVALEWGGVRYWHNKQGRGFEDRSEKAGFTSAGTGWWNSLAAADFNRDGRPDYVAGNLGLNTQYRAASEHPALLYSGDFTGDGTPQLVEGYYDEGRLFPRRTRKQLGGKIPTILKRFPRNDFYARATLGDIFGADKLAAAQRFTATEFRSGVFLSQPDGMHRFEPLPHLAQIAPLQGIVAGDFDGDGNADIYAVQNSFAPIPLVGHFDGGVSQLLRGDGRGHFTAVTPAESGLVVPGDAKALTMLDVDGDGWPDFVLTRNDGPTLAYRNQGVAGRRSLRVLLRGPRGNPTAVGARVTMELSNGVTQTSEVHAGSGYYSQSSAACFFGFEETNPPRRIRVRWPTGATTVHDAPFDSSTVTLSPPSP
jgi:enediyne biosynthesis protein E4